MRIFIALFLFLTSYTSFSQNMTTAKVMVVDSKTQDKLEDADVLIEELMLVEKSRQFGIATFEKVPMRQVTIEVTKDGYFPRKIEANITEDIFDNTFRVEILKAETDQLSVFGYLKGGGSRVNSAKLYLNVGSFQLEAESNESGYFYFSLPRTKIVSSINLLIKHQDFDDHEISLDVLQSESHKDLGEVLLDFSNGDPKELPSIGEKTETSFHFRVKKWRQVNGKVVIDLTVENIRKDRTIDLYIIPNSSSIFDSQAAVFQGATFKLANYSVSGDRGISIPIPSGLEAVATFEFDVGSYKLSEISMLRFYYLSGSKSDIVIK